MVFRIASKKYENNTVSGSLNYTLKNYCNSKFVPVQAIKAYWVLEV